MWLHARRLCSTRGARAFFGAVALLVAPAAWAADGDAGAAWRLAQDGSGHTCPLMLRFDPAGKAGALAMPAGCRRALPFLGSAKTWSIDDSGSIQFRDGAGQSLLTLIQHAGAWQGDDESGHSFTLTPPAATSETALQSDGSASVDQGPMALASPQIMTDGSRTAPDPSATKLATNSSKPASGSSVPAATGRYAVMRGDRDTGCMVTLEPGGKGSSRARLAPACRDQGITIFDPINWQMKGAQLTLTARKGHSISLSKDDNGVWIKMPKDDKALGLKPL